MTKHIKKLKITFYTLGIFYLKNSSRKMFLSLPLLLVKGQNLTWASSLKFKFLQLSWAVPRREQERRNISNSCVSRKLLAIFRCFVRERFASASDIWFISQVNWDSNWTPIMQCSTEPWKQCKKIMIIIFLLTWVLVIYNVVWYTFLIWWKKKSFMNFKWNYVHV